MLSAEALMAWLHIPTIHINYCRLSHLLTWSLPPKPMLTVCDLNKALTCQILQDQRSHALIWAWVVRVQIVNLVHTSLPVRTVW